MNIEEVAEKVSEKLKRYMLRNQINAKITKQHILR